MRHATCLARIPPSCLPIWWAAQAHESACHWLIKARSAKYPESRTLSVRFARQSWHEYIRHMRTVREHV